MNMQRRLMQTLMAASFAAMAAAVSAQTAAPTPPPGTQTPPPPATQPSMGTPPATTPGAQPPAMRSQDMKNRMTSEQMREYMDARNACASKPAAQVQSCTDDVHKKFTAIDPQCQKASGTALADCMRGMGRG